MSLKTVFDRAGVCITITNACIFCRTDSVANLMTTEKPDLGPQTRISSINLEIAFQMFSVCKVSRQMLVCRDVKVGVSIRTLMGPLSQS